MYGVTGGFTHDCPLLVEYMDVPPTATNVPFPYATLKNDVFGVSDVTHV